MGSRFAIGAMALFLTAGFMGCIGSGGSGSSGSKSATVTSIAVSPQDSAVTVGKTLQLSAKATYSDGSTKDITSSAAWQTSDQSVATVSAGAVSGVKPGVIKIQAGSGSVSVTTLLNVTSKQFKNGSLSGAYAFRIVTGLGLTGVQLEVGSLVADGRGSFSGVEDVNGPSGVVKQVSMSGTYSITADGRGTLLLTTSGETARTFRFVLSSNSIAINDNNGALIEFDATHNAIGGIEIQSPTAFANTAFANGTYVFRVGGLDAASKNFSTLGAFTVDALGTTISNGIEDANDDGTINNGAGSATPLTITAGTIGAVDGATGRATVSLTAADGGGTSDFAIYMVSANKVEMIGLDSNPSIGTAERQSSPAPSSVTAGGYVFLTDMGGVAGQFWMMGQMGVDKTSHFSNGVTFQDGNINANFIAPAASFTLGSNGRGTFQQNTSVGSLDCIVYLVSNSEIYLMQINDAHAPNGVAQLQSPGPDGFSSTSLNNTFVGSGAEIGDGNVTFLTQFVSDGLGNVFGIADVSQPQSGNPSQLVLSTVVLNAKYGTPNTIGGLTVRISSPGVGVTSLGALLVSSSSGVFVGQPNDADGMIVVQ